MITSFADLKANADKLNEAAKEAAVDKRADSAPDDRFWYPAVDKAGNGTAVIRYLPAPPGEDQPYVKLYTHEFKDPNTGKWYIENCLTSLGQEDPVGKYNRELWETGIEANKDIARRQKRKTYYFANVYIIKDSVNPENEGKVKIFKFSNWFYKQIKSKLIPEFEDVASIPVFDLWKGATFRIRIKTGEHRDYSASTWDSPEPLFKDDKKLEEIWLQEHALKGFVDPSNFKSYEELEKRFRSVIGLGGFKVGNDRPAAREEEPVSRRQKEEPVSPKTVDEAPPFSVEDGDEDLDYFSKLASDD